MRRPPRCQRSKFAAREGCCECRSMATCQLLRLHDNVQSDIVLRPVQQVSDVSSNGQLRRSVHEMASQTADRFAWCSVANLAASRLPPSAITVPVTKVYQTVCKIGLKMVWNARTRNLAITNRSRDSCAHNTPRASVVTPWPWNLG